MDSIWEGFGAASAVFWAFLGAFRLFLEHSKSNSSQAWVQDELQKAFWIDLRSILGRFWEGFQRVWEGIGRIWELFNKLCAELRGVSRDLALLGQIL